MLKHATIFSAIAATETKELQSTDLGPVLANSPGRVVLEINGATTPSWVLDIQGKVSPSGTYHNVDYSRIDNGAALTISGAQLTVNWSTAQYYVIPNPPPFLRLVAARTTGTITVYAYATDVGYVHA